MTDLRLKVYDIPNEDVKVDSHHQLEKIISVGNLPRTVHCARCLVYLTRFFDPTCTIEDGAHISVPPVACVCSMGEEGVRKMLFATSADDHPWTVYHAKLYGSLIGVGVPPEDARNALFEVTPLNPTMQTLLRRRYLALGFDPSAIPNPATAQRARELYGDRSGAHRMRLNDD